LEHHEARQLASITKNTMRMTHMHQHTMHTIFMFRITKTIRMLRRAHTKVVC
jgi:hypothetical protein